MTQSSFSQRYTQGQYLEHAPDWHANEAEWKAGRVHEMIERHGLAPSSVCDVGCGAGEILVELQKRMAAQVRFKGFDISPQALALAKAKANERLSFEQRDFLADSNESFDLVLLLDVLEHVPDYLTFLSRLSARGRYFIFHVPLDAHAMSVLRGSDYMLAMRREYGHLHYFTRETALATLEDCGYRVLDHFHTWDHEADHYGPRQFLEHPLRIGVHWLDRALYTIQPKLAASLRPHFNTLILAERAESAESAESAQG